MTKVIGYMGGPGIGKSTKAADLYSQYSKQGKSVELVREFIKSEYVWKESTIDPFIQIHAVASQMHRESSLFGKVDYIITDSPVILGLFYLDQVHNVPWFNQFVEGYHQLCQRYNVIHEYKLLTRQYPYKNEGRYQSQSEAEQIDEKLIVFLDKHKIKYELDGELEK